MKKYDRVYVDTRYHSKRVQKVFHNEKDENITPNSNRDENLHGAQKKDD